MSDDLVDRLHWHHNFIGTNPWSDGYPFLREVRDRLGEAAASIEQLERELSISRMAQVVMDNSVAEAEALMEDNARLREVLSELIQHTHNCERELTEDLHHVDFCGESVPLTNAREALIKNQT